ncbi:Crp/Fnr family transcriptional regulator [Tenacibaculum amylolyticum]|uniref:Crp/Fnr family transcriptional regulator n=1 Tax=Tenacibaculum amylolyticum TaxID=104269 RepID=UPI0038963C20
MLEDFFNNLRITEPALKEEIYKYATITEHDKGDVIIRNNEYIKVLKIILDGKIRVYQRNESREILIYYLFSMETCTLSLAACFEECQSNVGAITEEKTTILNIPVRFAKEWNFKYKSWNNFTINTFRKSYTYLIEEYASLAFKPLKNRLLDYLVWESDEAVVYRSHQELANELGTTREVISRLLKKLEKDNKLQLGKKEIILLETE